MEWEDALEKLKLLLLFESKESFFTESIESTPKLVEPLSVNELSSPTCANNFPRYEKWVNLAEKKEKKCHVSKSFICS